MMTNIYMIGVSHEDVQGPVRLRNTLLELRPDAVFCEGSQELDILQEAYLQTARDITSARNIDPELANVLMEEQELKRYESRIAKEYCSESGATFLYLDDTLFQIHEPDINSHVSQTVDGLVEMGKDMARYVLDTRRKLAGEYASTIGEAITKGVDTELSPLFLARNRHVGPKDAVMENNFRRGIEDTEYERIATITGMAHLLEDPKRVSFYCRLVGMNPSRFIIYG